MKAVISNRIFIEYTEPILENIRKELTYKIPSYNPTVIPPEIIKTYNRINSKVVSVPSGRLDLIPPGYTVVDSRVKNPIKWPKRVKDITLRESQQDIYDQVDTSCIINAPVSWGKTFTAVLIAEKLRQKTLIVVHTSTLRTQWREEIKQIYGESPSQMGDGHRSWDKWITVATVQTVVKYMDQLMEEFGTIIIDECHHIPASTFKSVLDRSKAYYKIGLSGTVIRKDGKHVIFNDYFGPVRYTPKRENSMTPEILRVKTDIRFGNEEDFNAESFAAKLTLLANNPLYVDLVVQTALHLANAGHHVLVVSERLDLLKNCYEITKDISVLVTGETNQTNRDKYHEEVKFSRKKIIWGTVSIYSEGFSMNILSALVMATVTNNDPLLEQLIGRVTRLYEGKPKPIVADFELAGNGVKRSARNRMLYFADHGYKVHTIEKMYGI